jgi:tetratricopeptide repeat protein
MPAKHRTASFRAPGILVMAIVLIAFLPTTYAFYYSPMTSTPNRATSAPAAKFATTSHDEMLREAAKTPLVIVELRSVSGQPLSDAEKADLKAINELLSASSAARRQGDYKSAAVSAVKAGRLQEKVLGKNHALTTVTAKEAITLALMSRASPVKKQEFAEADQQMEVAQAAAGRGDFSTARTAATQALGIRERVLGKEQVELLPVLRILGNAQTKLNSMGEAQQLLLRALKLAQSKYGKDHPETAWVLDRLGWLRICQGEYREAAEHLRRAVWIIQHWQGDTPETAESLDNLGTALAFSGDFEEALQSKLRALIIREKLLGPEAKETGMSYANLAWLYERIGVRGEGIGLHKKALAIFEKTLGIDHPDTIAESGNLAQAYYAAEQYQEAAQLYEQQIAREEKRPVSWGASAAEQLTMLAAVKLKLGQQSEAEQILHRSYDKSVKLYDGGERFGALRELLRIIDIYDRYRMLEDAAKTRETLLKWYEAQGADAADEAIRVSARLGSHYLDLGRAEQAADILGRTVRRSKEQFGEGDLETLEPLLALSVTYEKLGRLIEAVKNCEEALRVTENKLRKGSPLAIFALHLLGRIQLQQKKYEVAEFSLQDGLEQIKLTKIEDRVIEARILRELASCKWAQGNADEASKLFRQSIDKARGLSSDNNPYHKAELAASIHRFLDAARQGLPLDPTEREQLQSELRGILESLRDAHALDADNQAWLRDLPAASTTK